MKKVLTGLMVTFVCFLSAQDLPAYRLYDSTGQSTNFEARATALSEADIVLFGELHDDPIAHWLQFKLAQLWSAGPRPLIPAAEMLERDNQGAVDLFLSDSIDYTGLDSTARLWPNFKTDYLPWLQLAKDSGLSVVASNIPQSYARKVYRAGWSGLDELEEGEKQWMAPLPIPYDPNLPGYQAMLEMMGGHGGENLPKAQAIKDATMAFFISNSLKPGARLLHFNGDYHSKDFEGIVWYLNLYAPEKKVMTISTILQQPEQPLSEAQAKRAHYILVVDPQMTRTY